ncbi:hypothetical protein HH212_02895 [Massilia forsythiae]|uniref:Uncharacterized protein n=1 Tax=Massilia forsythiae TaxID=2728020 RepID=A0A7Z2ZR50_9BURK|nr:hypothetical protein [Massilia forsythiae]QJD99112.1 hypothetical protein HH212_02895 [Massilia forsythiae]
MAILSLGGRPWCLPGTNDFSTQPCESGNYFSTLKHIYYYQVEAQDMKKAPHGRLAVHP